MKPPFILLSRSLFLGGILSVILSVAVSGQTIMVTTLDDEDDGASSLSQQNDISLREAINHSLTGTTITFDTALSGGVITLNGNDLDVQEMLVVDATSLSGGITISGNGTSRVFNVLPAGDLTLSKLTIVDGNSGALNGGGIANQGALTLNGCTIRDCTAPCGGAITNSGAVNLDHCTITRNHASATGGIVCNGGTGSFTMNYCTAAGNTSPQTGGIQVFGGTVVVTNSILAGNGTNLEGSATTDDNNITSGDPLLAPLGHYGGPTMTMHPLAGSPAILTTANTTRTDQRGFTLTGPPTIGAVKIPAATEVMDESTLRTALEDSAAEPGKVITFAPSLNGQTITLSTGQLLVPSTANGLFIDASSLANGLTIDANQQSRVMEIQPNATVALHGLTLTGGNPTGSFPDNSGGAIYANGSGSGNSVHLSLSACTLSGNSASFGGGIFSDGLGGSATLSLSACTLSGNSATFGGGIFSFGNGGSATLSLSACTLSGNSAAFGGGIFSGGSEGGSATLSLLNTILAGNTAPTGPDLQEVGSPTEATTTASGTNLLSSIDDSNITSLQAGITVLTTPLLLAPLGHYGGPTMTMPPLPGSPAIDDAGTTNPGGTDQRGFNRFVGTQLDVGAVEFQGEAQEAFNAFLLDSDSDGSSNGLELAIGTNPFVPDASDERNLRLSIAPNGTPQFTLGVDDEQQDNIILRLTRSTDLITFDEIMSNEITRFNPFLGGLMLNDDNPPAEGKAFYRLEAEPRE